MNVKLGVSGAYNRTRNLSPINPNEEKPSKGKNSASYSRLEKETKHLRSENAKLKTELDDVRVALKQLISETAHEKFDERRINMLKFQMIQLERQIAVLNEALGARQAAVMEVENTLAWLANKFRSYIAAEVKGPMVPIARSDLTSMVELSESARIKLFKAIESLSKDSVGKDLLLLNPFFGGQHKQGEPVTLLDICIDRMNFINLRHVAQLESKLSQLYRELTCLQEQLHSTDHRPVFSHHRCLAERDRSETVVLKSCALIKDTAEDLLALSLLCPSSPWPSLKRPLTKDVPVERVLAALPSLPRGKQEGVSHVIQATVQTCKHRQLLLEKEKAVLKEELAFHRSVYDLQMQYTQALFDAVRKGYGEFEDSAKHVICKPVKDMLDAYKRLESSASENALRDFLVIMKENEQQLTSVVETFSDLNFEGDESGSAVFSKFGEEFMEKLNSLVSNCQKERDAALKRKKEVREEQIRIDLELQHLIEELEAKSGKMWVSKSTAAPSSMEDNEHCSVKNPIFRTNVNSGSDNRILASSAKVENDSVRADNFSELKEGKDDPTVFRSFLYDDSKDTSVTPTGHESQRHKLDRRKKWVSDFSLSAQAVEVSELYGKDGSQAGETRRWKPDREWDNDFSGLSESTQKDVSPSTGRSGESSARGATLKDSSVDKSGQLSSLSDTRDKPLIAVKKNTGKVKKQSLSYDSNTQVAQRTLQLKRSGSLTGGSKDITSGKD